MGSRASHLYEFGAFALDASERTLRSGEAFVRLTPKEMELLVALVRSGGRVVPKEELLKEVWPDTFVEEATLAQNVFTLRKALGRVDAGRQYIETVPRRGYRFVPKVRERVVEAGAAEEVSGAGVAAAEEFARPGEIKSNGAPARVAVGTAEAPAPAAHGPAGAPSANGGAADPARATPGAKADGSALPSPARPGHPVRAAVLISLAAVLGFGGLVYAVYRFSLRPHLAPREAAPFESMRLTRLPVPGTVTEAAVSPDGKVLAYITNEPAGQGIWVRQVAAASNSQQIVPPAEGLFYGALTFSPDGQHVYFGAIRPESPSAALRQVPVLGGPRRKVLEEINSHISFSPDGQRFAFVRGVVEEGRALYVADADGRNVRQVAASAPARVLVLPAWSPDGRTIACVYSLTEENASGRPHMGVAAFNVADGAETLQLPGLWFGINQLAWLPDGGGLLMSASERELSPPQIWRLSYPQGEVRRVTNDLNSYQSLSLTADAATLVTVQTDRVPNIWVAPASAPSRARQITSGMGKFDGYYGVTWAPDGRLVYSSIASGSWDIWVMNADGTGARQLTVGARSNYGPSVSPDGRHIVFLSNRAGGPFNIWRMDIDGSNPKQLTFGRGENFPHVTADGRWVVYATFGLGERDLIWKVPGDGGEPVAITDRPSSWPHVSPDGKWVVCVYMQRQAEPVKLAVVPIDGGEPVKLFDTSPTFRMNTVWLPDNRGIAYLDARDGTSNIWMQPLAGGQPVRLTDFTSDGVTAYDFSRDGKQLVVTRTAETTGIVLIQDFK
ncbi:MAG TPA: winged helix-turn-helix domain-containing protein [Pyrinomonadaceae bacterium]|nr:winged helix-turn-helix domain-containing protein [Pyrinomonadaceae bacterium]